MNKKGFTLVELLAVVIILALLALLTSTAVTKLVKDSKEDLYNTQIALIKSAAESWGADNLLDLPDSGECSYLTLADLKGYGLIDSDITDPRNNEPFSDDLKIKVTTTLSSYGKPVTDFVVNPESIDGCNAVYSGICTLANDSTVQGTAVGAKYTCNLGETTETQNLTFYVLGVNESDSNKIDLIMDRNYVDETVPSTMSWCVSGTKNSCNHDNLDPYIEHIQGVFGSSVTVSLPSNVQIYIAAGNKTSGLPLWLYDNLYTSTNSTNPKGYWTSTPYSDTFSSMAWRVYYSGILDNSTVNITNLHGLRPVITISKSSMD